MKKLLYSVIFLILVCCAEYDEIEGLSIGLKGSYWRSSETVVSDNQIYDFLYFQDEDTVFEYEAHKDGTPVSSLKKELKYSYRKGELIIRIAGVQHRGIKSGDFFSIFDRKYVRIIKK